jgi:hypothetical protein
MKSQKLVIIVSQKTDFLIYAVYKDKNLTLDFKQIQKLKRKVEVNIFINKKSNYQTIIAIDLFHGLVYI